MKKLVTSTLATVLSLALLVGCGGSPSPAPSESQATTESADVSEATTEAAPSESQQAAEGKKYKIAIMPKLVGIPYFNATETGAKKAGEDLGVEVIYTGPTQPDAAQQVKMIEDLINQGVDAIAIAPNDPAAVANVLKKASEKGILVLDWDTPVDEALVSASVHQIDDKELGEHLVDKLVEKMGTDSAEYAIITGGLSAANLNTWIDFGTSYAKEKYPNLKLVIEKQPSDEKQQEAMKKAIDLLSAYPNIKGFLGYSTPAPLGVAQAIREKGLQGKIANVGTAVKEDSQEYLEDGSLSVGVLWDPAKLGYLTIATAKHLLDGNTLDTLKVEGYDDLKVNGKVVIMGKPDDYTKQ